MDNLSVSTVLLPSVPVRFFPDSFKAVLLRVPIFHSRTIPVLFASGPLVLLLCIPIAVLFASGPLVLLLCIAIAVLFASGPLVLLLCIPIVVLFASGPPVLLPSTVVKLFHSCSVFFATSITVIGTS